MQFIATIVQGPHPSIFGAYTIPPFRFQPRNRSMDWWRMSALDVDRVIQELDVATLQENLIDITFSILDREVCSHCSQPLDQALLNVLRLAQLTIEYLMHCQDFLTTRVALLELHLQASLSQQSQSQQELDRQAEELRDLWEERHQQRKMIKDLQQLLQRSGGQSYYMPAMRCWKKFEVLQRKEDVVDWQCLKYGRKCHLCEKMFLNASCLWSHLQRRHEGMAQGEKQKQEESMEEVVRDLRAQLTSTQEELTALLKKQRQLQEAKTTCQRERDAKALFEEWKEELSEEIDQQKRVFWDELKSSVLPNSLLEEKPGAPQSSSGMCSNLGSLQDVECEELLRQTQEFEDLRILKDTKIQLQDENQELQRENNNLQEEKEKMQKENEKLQKEKEKLQEENEKLQKDSEKLQKENERLHDMLCQLDVTPSQSQQHIMSPSTQMQPQARLITSQDMTQTPSCRKVKAWDQVQCIGATKRSFSSGSPKDPKAVNMDKRSSIEEPEESQDEQQKVLEAQGQNISLLKLFGQRLENDLQEQQESTGRKRDAKEVPRRTFRHFRKEKGEKKEGKFSEWCSKASERAARWFSGPRKRARQRW